MGIEPFLITSAMIGCGGQRLVRRICLHCKAEYEPTAEERALYERLNGVPKDVFYRGSG